MNLANPSALLWAALAIPVVVFYILKIRLRRVPVSTVIFWRQIFEEKKPRSLWERLRHLLSLFAQLVLLLLLVGALTEPFFHWEVTRARRVVLVIDNSASMNATDVAPSRLAVASREGQRIIAGLRHLDEMAIVAAGTQPRVVCGLTGHQRTLRDALASVTPTDGPTRLVDAVALARRLAAESEGQTRDTRIIVLTDGCAEGAARLAEGGDVQFVAVGKRTPNLGISRFQVRRSPIDPIGFEVLIEVVNQSEEPAEFRLDLALEDNVQDVIPLKLEPNGKWAQVLEKVSADGGRLRARLMKDRDAPHEDALAADNSAVALLPKRELQPVALTRPEPHLFLEKVLEANPLVRLKIDKQVPPAAPAGAVHVFHRTVPNALPPGPVFVIDPTVDCDLWTVGDKLQNPIVTSQEKDSPFMAHLRLDNVLMPEARKLSFSAAAGKPHVLAGSVSGDPLFVVLDRPAGKVVVLTVNLDQGDLPLRTAFPIMVANLLSEFAAGRGELREAFATGATTEVNLPSTGEAGELLLKAPDGTTRKLPPGVARTTIGPFDQCGVWAVVPSGPDAKPIEELACNLANRAESDVRPPADLPAVFSATEAGLVSGILGRPVWFFLIALAWMLVAVEWWLYQRRFIS